MEGHAQKCVELYCELAQKTVDQLHRVSTLCLVDHQVKIQKFWKLWENSQNPALRSDCLQTLAFGRTWKTRFILDSKLLDQISHKVEISVRWHVSSVTFIAHPTTDIFVTLEIHQYTANWDYSKTPFLQEIWRSQSQPQVCVL